MRRGYRYEREKFGISGLSPVPSETLEAPRVRECPVQLEAKVEGLHHLAEHDTAQRGRVLVIEVRIQRVHLEESILMQGGARPDRPGQVAATHHEFPRILWTRSKLLDSALAQIPESMFRGPDIERARSGT
jgi:flavin reductase (DIM6/NTAB) family NADH-FMN oxidoreductase RutF